MARHMSSQEIRSGGDLTCISLKLSRWLFTMDAFLKSQKVKRKSDPISVDLQRHQQRQVSLIMLFFVRGIW